jgi:hypothetical protein
MPELDPYAVLRAIGEHPEAFAEIDTAVAKAARDLILKQLKSKSLTIEDARVIREAIGPDAFDPIVEGLPAAGLKSIVAKFDKHHPELKGSSPAWLRQHLGSLLGGTAGPTQKAAKPRRPGPQPKTAAPTGTPIGFKTEAMSVFRESLKRK